MSANTPPQGICWRPGNMMRLEGGPLHGRVIEDMGTVTQKFVIYRGGRPVKGAECGDAIYEPSPDRTHSFFLGTIWDGSTLVEEIDADLDDGTNDPAEWWRRDFPEDLR